MRYNKDDRLPNLRELEEIEQRLVDQPSFRMAWLDLDDWWLVVEKSDRNIQRLVDVWALISARVESSTSCAEQVIRLAQMSKSSYPISILEGLIVDNLGQHRLEEAWKFLR